jgi:hypothetical protein
MGVSVKTAPLRVDQLSKCAFTGAELRVPVTRSICHLSWPLGLVYLEPRAAVKGVGAACARQTRRMTRVTLYWVGTPELW